MKLEDNFTVSSITSKETYDWLLYKHYLKRIPSISFSFGLFDRSVLVGVVTGQSMRVVHGRHQLHRQDQAHPEQSPSVATSGF